MSHTKKLPVIIVGAGIAGLVCAQALKKKGIDFLVFERDIDLRSRSSGWGLSILEEDLQRCLPDELHRQLHLTHVDQKSNPTDEGTKYLNLKDGKPILRVPSNRRRRVDRGKLRQLLSTNIESKIRWGNTADGFQQTANGVSVSFVGGKTVEGCMLVAADGGRSKMRLKLMGEEKGSLKPIRIRNLAFTVRLTKHQFDKIKILYGSLFQGTHPETGYYMFFSVLSTPAVNESEGTLSPYYDAEVNLSWQLHGSKESVPPTNSDSPSQIRDIATASSGFHESIRQIIQDIPDDTKVHADDLADWLTVQWPDLGGRVALLGDAAHHMAMYRGEGANQGIKDAISLSEQLALWYDGQKTLQEAVVNYMTEMIPRAREAVKLSRQASLDAHKPQNITRTVRW